MKAKRKVSSRRLGSYRVIESKQDIFVLEHVGVAPENTPGTIRVGRYPAHVRGSSRNLRVGDVHDVFFHSCVDFAFYTLDNEIPYV